MYSKNSRHFPKITHCFVWRFGSLCCVSLTDTPLRGFFRAHAKKKRWNTYKYNVNKHSEALEPRLAHSCGSLSRFLWHKAARSISTPPGRDASPSQVTPQQFVRFPQQFAATHLYSLVERGTVRVKCLAQHAGGGPVGYLQALPRVELGTTENDTVWWSERKFNRWLLACEQALLVATESPGGGLLYENCLKRQFWYLLGCFELKRSTAGAFAALHFRILSRKNRRLYHFRIATS